MSHGRGIDMMKKYFKAMATLTDGKKEFDVTIYSKYTTEEAARKGIDSFLIKGYNVVKTWIE